MPSPKVTNPIGTGDLIAAVRHALAKIPGHAEVKTYPESGYHEVLMDADYYRLWQYAPEWLAALVAEVERLQTDAIASSEETAKISAECKQRRARLDAAERVVEAVEAYGDDQSEENADALESALDAYRAETGAGE